MRTDDKILYAYENNKHISGLEIRRLYQLVEDPWNYTSSENMKSMEEFAAHVGSKIDLNSVDYLIDFGCGVGAFISVIKKINPKIQIIGVDFDEAFNQGRRLFNAVDHEVVLENGEDEYSLLTKTLKYEIPEGSNVVVNFLNSSYYLFLDQDSAGIEAKLRELILHLTKGITPKNVIVSNSGFSYARINNTSKSFGLKQINGAELFLDNSEPKFKTALTVKIFG